jgi:hypothetical protein
MTMDFTHRLYSNSDIGDLYQHNLDLGTNISVNLNLTYFSNMYQEQKNPNESVNDAIDHSIVVFCCPPVTDVAWVCQRLILYHMFVHLQTGSDTCSYRSVALAISASQMNEWSGIFKIDIS